MGLVSLNWRIPTCRLLRTGWDCIRSISQISSSSLRMACTLESRDDMQLDYLCLPQDIKLLSSMLKGWSNWDKMALDGGYMMWISCYARETEKCGQSHAKHYKKRKRKKEKGGWKRWKKKKKFNGISGRHRAQERWGKEANKDEHIGMIYGGWAKKVMLLQADSAYKVSQAPFILETFYFMS